MWELRERECTRPQRCSICKVRTYCCQACQREDWPLHKRLCTKSGTHTKEATPAPAGEEGGNPPGLPAGLLSTAIRIVERVAAETARAEPGAWTLRKESRVARDCMEHMARTFDQWEIVQKNPAVRERMVQAYCAGHEAEAVEWKSEMA